MDAEESASALSGFRGVDGRAARMPARIAAPQPIRLRVLPAARVGRQDCVLAEEAGCENDGHVGDPDGSRAGTPA